MFAQPQTIDFDIGISVYNQDVNSLGGSLQTSLSPEELVDIHNAIRDYGMVSDDFRIVSAQFPADVIPLESNVTVTRLSNGREKVYLSRGHSTVTADMIEDILDGFFGDS